MPLVDGTITHERYIPGEPGEMMTFRHLTRKQLNQAREALEQQTWEKMRKMGSDLLKTLRSAESGERTRDPLIEFDVDTLLRLGIVSWTYDAPVTEESIERLSEDTAEWAARTLLEIAGVIKTEETSKNA